MRLALVLGLLAIVAAPSATAEANDAGPDPSCLTTGADYTSVKLDAAECARHAIRTLDSLIWGP